MPSSLLLFAMIVGTAASAASGAGEPVPTDSRSPPARRMLERALTGPLADCRELVFAVRSVGSDGHYHAKFGYYVRKMKRYGILPADFVRGSPLDVWATGSSVLAAILVSPVTGHSRRRSRMKWHRG